MLRSARRFAGGAMLALMATPVSAQAPGQTVVLGGGCCWGIQNLVKHVKDLHRHTPVPTASR